MVPGRLSTRLQRRRSVGHQRTTAGMSPRGDQFTRAWRSWRDLTLPSLLPGNRWRRSGAHCHRRRVFRSGADPTVQGNLPSLFPRVPATFTSIGIYYAVDCSQTGVWTDPQSGVCSDASSPLSYALCVWWRHGLCDLSDRRPLSWGLAPLAARRLLGGHRYRIICD